MVFDISNGVTYAFVSFTLLCINRALDVFWKPLCADIRTPPWPYGPIVDKSIVDIVPIHSPSRGDMDLFIVTGVGISNSPPPPSPTIFACHQSKVSKLGHGSLPFVCLLSTPWPSTDKYINITALCGSSYWLKHSWEHKNRIGSH